MCEVYYDTPKLEYTDASIYGFYEKQNGTMNGKNWYRNGGKTIWWEWYNSNTTWYHKSDGQPYGGSWYNSNTTFLDGYGQWNLGNETKNSILKSTAPTYFVAHTDIIDNGTDFQSADWRLATEDINLNDVWNYAGKKLKIRCKYQQRRKCQLPNVK